MVLLCYLENLGFALTEEEGFALSALSEASEFDLCSCFRVGGFVPPEEFVSGGRPLLTANLFEERRGAEIGLTYVEDERGDSQYLFKPMFICFEEFRGYFFEIEDSL
jgi:hypothetical protein